MTSRVDQDASVVMPLGWEEVSGGPGRIAREFHVEVALDQEGRLALVGHFAREWKSWRSGRDDLVLAGSLLQAHIVLGDALDRPKFLRRVRCVGENRAERGKEKREKRKERGAGHFIKHIS